MHIGPDSEAPITLGQEGREGAFLAKFDTNGDVVWASEIEGGDTRSMAMLANGTIAVAGISDDSVVFDREGPKQLVLGPGDTLQVAYVAWFGPTGAFLHAAAITGYPDFGLHVAAGANNSTQLISTGSVTVDDGTTSLTTETAGLYRCVFNTDAEIERLDLLVEATSSLFVGAVALGASGDVFITGDLQGSVVLAPGLESEVHLGQDTAGTFVLHYTPELQLDWHRIYGGVGSGAGEAIVPDPLVPGGAIVAGRLRGEVTLGAGEANNLTLGQPSQGTLYVARFSESGNLRWGRSPSTQGPYNQTSALAIRPDYSIVAVGKIGSDTVLGEGQDNASALEVQHIAQGFIAVFGL